MKIAIRGGHNPQATGANGYINELNEDRKVKDVVINYLRKLGYDVLDVTPGKCNSNSDLKYGVNKANNWGADLFVSIHFNAFKNTSKAMGTEVCVYKPNEIAQRIINKLSNLGFKNRGQKVRGTELYELRASKMQAIIIEVCFVDSKADSDLYKKLGVNVIGKAIAEGITKEDINIDSSFENYPPNGEIQKMGRVIASNLNVRTGRGTNYPVIGTLSKGEMIELYYCMNGWASMESKFKYNGFKTNNFVCIGDNNNKYVQII